MSSEKNKSYAALSSKAASKASIAPAQASRSIQVRGAREHNLTDINVDIPRDSFVVLTGLSGSGKSSLAFDTIYAEGQRRLCRIAFCLCPSIS